MARDFFGRHRNVAVVLATDHHRAGQREGLSECRARDAAQHEFRQRVAHARARVLAGFLRGGGGIVAATGCRTKCGSRRARTAADRPGFSGSFLRDLAAVQHGRRGGVEDARCFARRASRFRSDARRRPAPSARSCNPPPCRRASTPSSSAIGACSPFGKISFIAPPARHGGHRAHHAAREHRPRPAAPRNDVQPLNGL